MPVLINILSAQWPATTLQAGWQAGVTEAAGQGDRRMTCHIEWGRVALQLQDQIRLRAQAANRREIEWRKARSIFSASNQASR
jgi:hypothetical protein